MKLMYHLPILPPKMVEAEALSQEITALRHRYGGELCYLNPNGRSPIYLPRLLFGFHKLKALWAKEAELDLHHFYNPDPFPYPILRRLRRPVVYTISSGLGRHRPKLAYFKKLAAVAVADERSFKQLRAVGLDNSFLVRPGIDTTRFSFSPLALGNELKVLVASAPWSTGQFRSKGIDALLCAAQQAPWLHLIFLWRGVLIDEMKQRLSRLNLGQRVTVINRQVEVNQILAGVHATIVLATDPAIIKAYPHSLLDSLAAGKPVLVSQSLPMADYVAKSGCGVVVSRVAGADIVTAGEILAQQYERYQQVACQVGQRDFTLSAMLDSYAPVYQYALTTGQGR
jgi:glycosyltransferase involved in cell wall biosynthesis